MPSFIQQLSFIKRLSPLKRISSIKLKHKVFAGFLSVGLIAMSVAWVGYDSFNHVLSNLKAFIEQENRAELHLTMARNVSEIQRQALIYTYQGHASAAERVHALYQQMQKSLQARGSHLPDRTDVIEQHLDHYMQAFAKLQQQRDLQFDLIHRQLKGHSLRAQTFVATLLWEGTGGNTQAHLVKEHVMNSLLRVESDAAHYFDVLDPLYITNVKNHFRSIRKQLNSIQTHPEQVINKQQFQHGQIMIDTYERVFLEAVQRTRAYLFLVNVVMSAEAYEVLYQADKLSEMAGQEMNAIEQRTMSTLEKASTMMLYGMLLALLVIVLVSYFISRSITQPVVRLTRAFNALSQGAHQTAIPAYDVDDEIGHLTQAAFAFKENILQTEALLAQTKGMNVELNTYKENLEMLVQEKTQEIHVLSAVVSHVNVAIMITDPDRVIEYVNPAFTQLTGYSSVEVVGRRPDFLDDGSRSKQFYQTLWNKIQSDGVWQGRMMNKRKDDTLYPSLLSISVIQGGDGGIEHLIGVQKDITEHEKLEGQLHHARKLESVGTLVGGIAHEFNNSLAGITGNVYLAKVEAVRLPAVLDKLEVIESLSFASAELIKSLLSFARKGHVQKTSIHIGSFLLETIELQRLALPKNMALKTALDIDALMVEGDANILRQVLMNIMNNASDAMADAAKPCMSIEATVFHADQAFFDGHPECGAASYVRIAIRDNGTGIKADDLPHVFDPFFTTKEVGKGTGLGLSMAYGAMRTHSGAIEIDTQLGQGTSLILYLAVASGVGVIEPQQLEAIVHGQHELILCVDDNQDILTVGSNILQNIGYRVLTASSGAEAISLYKANRDNISLVLMDVVMPMMNGVEAVEKMRAIKPDVKVIFSTGYDRNSLAQSEAVEEETLISKPFTIQLLSQTIRDKLS